MRRDVIVLALLALATRAAAALLVDYPPYTDPAYYGLVAEQLAAGNGFNVPVLWSFLEVGGRLPADPSLPVPSNGHWMPLTSVLAAGSIAAFGDWFGPLRAGQLPMILLGAALVPFTYAITLDLWRSRFSAWLAALIMLTAGPMLVMAPLIDNFAVFGAAGAAALWCSIRSIPAATPIRAALWLVGAGAAAGIATLARVDGLLLAVAPAVAWWQRGEWRRWPVAGVAAAAAAAVAFGMVLAPWIVRDLAVFGAAFPSAGGHTLWITAYNQQFSISSDPTLASYLAQGPLPIVGSKLGAWGELAGRSAVLLGGLFVLPFAYGLWAERRRPELAPFLAYFALMFVVMGAVFTFHAPKGAYYHSALAWLPLAAGLAAANLGPAATAAGRVWPFLRRPATHRFLAVAGLAGAFALSVVGSSVLLRQWGDAHAKLEQAAAFLRASAERSNVVMAYDPSALHALSGLPGVAPPFDPFPVIGEVVEAYEVRWVVVTLRESEQRDPLGLWEGGMATDAEGNRAEFLAADPAFEAPGVRVYEVVASTSPPGG